MSAIREWIVANDSHPSWVCRKEIPSLRLITCSRRRVSVCGARNVSGSEKVGLVMNGLSETVKETCHHDPSWRVPPRAGEGTGAGGSRHRRF